MGELIVRLESDLHALPDPAGGAALVGLEDDPLVFATLDLQLAGRRDDRVGGDLTGRRRLARPGLGLRGRRRQRRILVATDTGAASVSARTVVARRA